MIRSSPSLLFRPVPALQKFKIHPPLPLNPRESKQLLALLTTSFRQQLDKEHGPSRSAPVKSTTGQRTRSLKVKARYGRQSLLDSETSIPTDRHLHSILSNPLFNYSTNIDTSRSSTSRDPMDIFDEAVAKGLMKIEYARGCLEAKRREITQSSILSIQQGMKDSGAGLKVLRWLKASGIASGLEFLKNEDFAKVLMEYIAAEGLQEVIWVWIRETFRTMKSSHLSRYPEARRDVVRPLMLLVQAEALGSLSLDAAYTCMHRASSYLDDKSVAEIRAVLGPPGMFLSNETTALSSRRRPPASPSSFESFVRLMPVMTIYTRLHIAHLDLHHPTRPSATSALAFLELEMKSQDRSSTKSHARTFRENKLINLGLDTAKFLLEHDQYDDAKWVMDFLRSNYPSQLGFGQQIYLERAKAEAVCLELLESLGIA